jgi:AraC-like DNA-binding protein
VDPLSDLLRVIRLNGAFFFAVEAADPWAVETAAARDLRPRILPTSEHLIPYHILTEGHCFGGVVGEQPVELVAGDVLIIPHGEAHIMSSGPTVPGGIPVNRTAPRRYPDTVLVGDSGPHGTAFVCGFLGCDLRPFNPLLSALPRQLHVRGMSPLWTGDYTRQLVEETRLRRAGADLVITRLAELMFIQVLRRYLEDLPPGHTGWLAGLRDQVVGRVLALVHARPAHPWTLAELAREVASSRTAVAQRFTELVGQPPMQYLTRWRMQVAANLLAQGNAKVAAIGREVGYESEAAFSRAFKKATGQAPGTWREARGGSDSGRPSRKSGRSVIG